MQNNLKQKVRQALQIIKEADTKEFDFAKVAAGAKFIQPDKDVNAIIASRALIRASHGELLTPNEREALAEYLELFTTLLAIPNLRARLKNMQVLLKKSESDSEPEPEPEDDSEKNK